MRLLSFATAWGPKHGGINPFNSDLLPALRKLPGVEDVYCAVASASEEDKRQAHNCGVTLLTATHQSGNDGFPQDLDTFLPASIRGRIDWWLGHDLSTGPVAKDAAHRYGGHVALIMHTSPIEYLAQKHGSGLAADRKHARQLSLFKSNVARFAVGPLLRDACRDLVGVTPSQLVPGFPSFIPNSSPNDKVIAITFGRLDIENELVKQGRLAVAAFSAAVKSSYEYGAPSSPLASARMFMVGLTGDLKSEEETIAQLSQQYVARVINIIGLPFDHDRDQLIGRLATANLAMVLSWHEGFGLTGWEAIGSEIPLIISKRSGVYRLIDETLGGSGTGCLHPIEIEGSLQHRSALMATKRDVDNASALIRRVSGDIGRAKEDARNLRIQLCRQLGCQWSHTANELLRGLVGRPEPACASTPLANESAAKQRQLHAPSYSNAIPELAELIPSLPQGSTAQHFDILPELRFGSSELPLDDGEIEFSLIEAELRMNMTGCWIEGQRLGDTDHPNIISKGAHIWRVVGPMDAGSLARRSLGDEVVCSVVTGEDDANVEIYVTCKQRHVRYSFHDIAVGVNKQRVLELLTNKTIGMKEGIITLSHATYRVGSANE